MLTHNPQSMFLNLLKDRLDLTHIPFSDRMARMMMFRSGDSFYIRLAERWEKQQSQLGNYRQRHPIVDALRLIGPDGAPLPFKLTTYPHQLVLDTPLGAVQCAFADPETLYFALPAQPIGFQFEIQAERASTDRRGCTFHGMRNTACTFSVRLRHHHVESLGNGLWQAEFVTEGSDPAAESQAAMLLNTSPRLGYNRSVLPAAEVFGDAEKRWHDWFAAAPPVAEPFQLQYYYAWWVMRSGLISPRYYMTREGMTPSKIHYVGVWQWDAYFHALAYRHVDMKLAEDQIRLVLDHQRADGMLPDAVHDEGIVTHLAAPVEADVTKPPLIAWVALKLYEHSGHRDFLDEIYEPLCRWNQWWFEKNDDDHDGICQYNHPFSSGLDDSPLWDSGMPVESPDLNTYLCLQMESLSRIARIIGEEADSAMWAERADAMARRMIEHFWDPEAGVFWATHNHQPIRVLTPFNLYPLWTGRLPREMDDRLVAHLTNPQEFWAPYPLPTVSRSDPAYDPNQMWRGPTWVNINYLFIDGLERNGYTDLAHRLRRRTLDLVMGHDDIFEYYHPETGVHPPHAAPIFGWTSAVFIDLAIRASQSAASK
jgi:glycogen debranching enzyme